MCGGSAKRCFDTPATRFYSPRASSISPHMRRKSPARPPQSSPRPPGNHGVSQLCRGRQLPTKATRAPKVVSSPGTRLRRGLEHTTVGGGRSSGGAAGAGAGHRQSRGELASSWQGKATGTDGSKARARLLLEAGRIPQEAHVHLTALYGAALVAASPSIWRLYFAFSVSFSSVKGLGFRV